MTLLPVCVPENCDQVSKSNLKKSSPDWPHGSKHRKTRVVPAFTIQAMQKNTKVHRPPKSGIYDPKPIKQSMFKKCCERGEFPLFIKFVSSGKVLSWRVPVEKLDYHHYLPIFFDGLAETEYPFNFIAVKGIDDLTKAPHKVLPVIPQIIMPLKNALSTKTPSVIIHACKCIQMLVTRCRGVGEALVPYYRNFLPVFNLFISRRNRNTNTISQGNDISQIIEDTLLILEQHGGPDAFINIKYMIPTYESCVLN